MTQCDDRSTSNLSPSIGQKRQENLKCSWIFEFFQFGGDSSSYLRVWMDRMTYQEGYGFCGGSFAGFQNPCLDLIKIFTKRMTVHFIPQ